MHRPSIRRRLEQRPRIREAAPRARRSAALPAAGAAAGLALLAGAALVGRTNGYRVAPVDRRAHALTALSRNGGWRYLLDPRSQGRHPLAYAAAAVGGKRTTLLAALVAAAVAARARGPAHAMPFLASYAASYGMHGALKPAVRRKRPWAARLLGKRTPSFPSGHGARIAAVSGLIGYVAIAEGLARPRLVVPLGVAASLASGGGRLVNERHWATDIVGGWGLGVTVASLCALWYDRIG